MSVKQLGHYKRQLAQQIMTHAPHHPHAGPVRLELIRHSTGQPMDEDNLVSTGKYPIDQLVRAGILPDDKPEIIVERHYSQTRALNRHSQFTLIRILDLPLP